MARIECRLPNKPKIPSVWVEIDGITDAQVKEARAYLDALRAKEAQISDAVALAYVHATEIAPTANPSDLWQHVIYRHLLADGWSDNTWKRVSGFALERALVGLLAPRLAPYDLRMRILSANEANALLDKLGIPDVRATKIDMFLEGKRDGKWVVFGAAHAKASIAERIQDDVPASTAFMKRGLLSIALTMDSKSSPPPGNCINYGEFGGRSIGVDKERLKRRYVEVDGQFDGLFSFNLRTPPSGTETKSGKRIYTMSLQEKQPDQLVRFIVERWKSHATGISI